MGRNDETNKFALCITGSSLAWPDPRQTALAWVEHKVVHSILHARYVLLYYKYNIRAVAWGSDLQLIYNIHNQIDYCYRPIYTRDFGYLVIIL